MKYTIEDLRNGDCAVINDGTKEELQKVLRAAEGKQCKEYYGDFDTKYYWNGNMFWNNFNYKPKNLPTQSVKDFLTQLEFPKDDFGVIVDNGNGKEIIDLLVECGFENWRNLDNHLCDGDYYFINKGDNALDITTRMHPPFKNPTSRTFTLAELKTLKQNNMKEKEIIGYKLVKEEYYKAMCSIGDERLCSADINGTDAWYQKYGYLKLAASHSIRNLKKAGVLDLWFEPVYREEKQLPKINGYEGKMDGDYIIYGSNCAKFHKDFFTDLVHLKPQGQNRAIKSITLDSGVTITMEQINKIVDYINSKK